MPSDISCCPATFTDPRRFEACKPKQFTNIIPLSNYERLRNLKQQMKCCGTQIFPAVHPGGRAKPEGVRIEAAGALAGRGSVSFYDSNNRTEWATTLRKQGYAAFAEATKSATCNGCVISGTTYVTPGQTTNVLPPAMCGCSSN